METGKKWVTASPCSLLLIQIPPQSHGLASHFIVDLPVKWAETYETGLTQPTEESSSAQQPKGVCKWFCGFPSWVYKRSRCAIAVGPCICHFLPLSPLFCFSFSSVCLLLSSTGAAFLRMHLRMLMQLSLSLLLYSVPSKTSPAYVCSTQRCLFLLCTFGLMIGLALGVWFLGEVVSPA